MNVTERFDELTKAVAGGKSRREILRLSAAMLGGLALVFRDPDAGFAGDKVSSADIRNRKCEEYSVKPQIIAIPIGEHAEMKPIRTSLCVGVVQCTGQRMAPDGLHEITFKDSAVCFPIRGESDDIKDAYCPSAIDCNTNVNVDYKAARVLVLEPKGILPTGVTKPPSEK